MVFGASGWSSISGRDNMDRNGHRHSSRESESSNQHVFGRGRSNTLVVFGFRSDIVDDRGDVGAGVCGLVRDRFGHCKDKGLRRLKVMHVDPKIELARRMNERYPQDPKLERSIGHVFSTGRAALVEHISPQDMIEGTAENDEHLEMLRELDMHSYIAVPLTSKGQIYGVLTFPWRSLVEGTIKLI